MDVELPDVAAYGTLAEEVRGGRVSEEAVDRAVARVLRVKFLAGLFEDSTVDARARRRGGKPAGRTSALALEAAPREPSSS